MKITTDIDKFKGGWWIGSFSPSAYKTDACEVCYKIHPKGEDWPEHYHKQADESNYLIEGTMRINGTELTAPIIFIIEKGETTKAEFLTDCKIIVVKIPGVLNDKFVIEDQK